MLWWMPYANRVGEGQQLHGRSNPSGPRKHWLHIRKQTRGKHGGSCQLSSPLFLLRFNAKGRHRDVGSELLLGGSA